MNYSVGQYFATNYPGSYYDFSDPLRAVDTIIHLQTAPGVYTKVRWRKNFAGNTFKEGVSSIIFTPG